VISTDADLDALDSTHSSSSNKSKPSPPSPSSPSSGSTTSTSPLSNTIVSSLLKTLGLGNFGMGSTIGVAVFDSGLMDDGNFTGRIVEFHDFTGATPTLNSTSFDD